MVAVAEKKESVRQPAQVRLPEAVRPQSPVVKIPADAEQQIQELERTFTDRWEW